MDKRVYMIVFGILLALGLALLFVFGGGAPKEKPKSGELTRTDSWVKGSVEAKVKIVEFSDLQCPACKMAEPELKKVFAEYGDNVSLTYRHFPLSQHKFSLDASKAAEAAGRQGKFWEMHDIVFENQEKLKAESFAEFATTLGLNIDKFQADLADPAIAEKIDLDQRDGESLGVDSTPTFFLNGEKLEGGGLTLEDWKKIIDKKLAGE